MKIVCTWKEKMLFEASAGKHTLLMDAKAPIGTDQSATPKELLLSAICGCTAMDVAALLRKGRQTAHSFSVEGQAEVHSGHPAVFTSVHLHYKVEGDVDGEILSDAVKKSMTQYCAVSAMISKSCPVIYDVELNGNIIAKDQANFPSAG